MLNNTGPTYQNAEPLSAPPDRVPALKETQAIAALGDELDALVVPIPLAIANCLAARPEVTLRYVNDGHLNLPCGYLTGCMFYSALFEKSPMGLAVDSMSDPKIVDRSKPDLGPDGDPRSIVFSPEMLSFIQTIAWESTQEFQQLIS